MTFWLIVPCSGSITRRRLMQQQELPEVEVKTEAKMSDDVKVKEEPVSDEEDPDQVNQTPFVPPVFLEPEEPPAPEPEEDIAQASPVERSMEIEESTVKEDSTMDVQDDVVENKQTEVGHSEESEKPTEVKQLFYEQYDITGNEKDSIHRKLQDCFQYAEGDEWCGFYNRGYGCYPEHKHQTWHLKYRVHTALHPHAKHGENEASLMKEYILRHYNEDVLKSLQEIADSTCYECSDPRLYSGIREDMEKKTQKAKDLIAEDFNQVEAEVKRYIDRHGVIPYCVICRNMARAFLGGGILEERDANYPYNSSAALSVMFWNAGNWCRQIFAKTPLPNQLDKYFRNIKTEIDEFHQPIRHTQHNNYFINVVKNLAAHVFLNCEAGTLYDHKELLELQGWTLEFNDNLDLMCAARVGKDGYVKRIAGPHSDHKDMKPRFVSWAIFEINFGRTLGKETQYETFLQRSRMNTIRVCVYHVSNTRISKSPGITGEVLAIMSWECMVYQVDIIAGDGNKAAYYSTPKNPTMPTYDGGLIQFWINRMVHTATQSRRKNFNSKAIPVRAKHFISSSYEDLTILRDELGHINKDGYTKELAKKAQLW